MCSCAKKFCYEKERENEEKRWNVYTTRVHNTVDGDVSVPIMSLILSLSLSLSLSFPCSRQQMTKLAQPASLACVLRPASAHQASDKKARARTNSKLGAVITSVNINDAIPLHIPLLTWASCEVSAQPHTHTSKPPDSPDDSSYLS